VTVKREFEEECWGRSALESFRFPSCCVCLLDAWSLVLWSGVDGVFDLFWRFEEMFSDDVGNVGQEKGENMEDPNVTSTGVKLCVTVMSLSQAEGR
jgi:hypothetical protein